MTFGISDSLIGTILAYHSIQQFDLINFICGIAIAFVAIFVANLSNSYCDKTNGVDTAEEANDRAMFELGLTESNIFWALAFYVFVTLVSYAVLWYRLPFDVFQMALIPYVLAMLISVGYTAGPYPLKYHALGEMYPILINGFFISGAYITQCQSFNVNILIYYIPFCLAAIGPMHTNNTRDIIPDTKAGITTIPLLLGHKWSCYNHCGAFILDKYEHRNDDVLEEEMEMIEDIEDPELVVFLKTVGVVEVDNGGMPLYIYMKSGYTRYMSFKAVVEKGVSGAMVRVGLPPPKSIDISSFADNLHGNGLLGQKKKGIILYTVDDSGEKGDQADYSSEQNDLTRLTMEHPDYYIFYTMLSNGVDQVKEPEWLQDNTVATLHFHCTSEQEWKNYSAQSSLAMLQGFIPLPSSKPLTA
eukprot:gene17164-20443_t